MKMAVSVTGWVFLGVYLVYCLFMAFYVVHFHKKLRFLQRHEICDNIHLPAFQRKDYRNWNRFYFFLGAVLLLPIRLLALLTLLLMYYLIMRLLTLLFCYCDFSKKQSKAFIRISAFIARVIGRSMMFCFGFYWISEEEVVADQEDTRYFYDYGEVDYSVVISNHVHFFDSLYFLASKVQASFIANIKVKSMPLVGFLLTIMQTIFVDRSNPESRKKCILDLKQRIQKIKASPESIFPNK